MRASQVLQVVGNGSGLLGPVMTRYDPLAFVNSSIRSFLRRTRVFLLSCVKFELLIQPNQESRTSMATNVESEASVRAFCQLKLDG